MRKKLLGIGIILILCVMLISLTGCGDNQSNNIVKDLNDTVSEEVSDWKEKGYGATLSVYNIQNKLNKKNLQYVIVASGDKEFTSAPGITEYKESDVPNYDGNSYSIMRMLEEQMTVKHFVVYEKETGKYYDVEVSYEKADLNGAKKEYPVFSNAKEIK